MSPLQNLFSPRNTLLYPISNRILKGSRNVTRGAYHGILNIGCWFRLYVTRAYAKSTCNTIVLTPSCNHHESNPTHLRHMPVIPHAKKH